MAIMVSWLECGTQSLYIRFCKGTTCMKVIKLQLSTFLYSLGTRPIILTSVPGQYYSVMDDSWLLQFVKPLSYYSQGTD